MPEERLCPCGKPARKLYCSRHCSDKAWYSANRDKKREYYQQNKDAIRRRVTAYAASRKKETAEYDHARYCAKRQDILARKKQYYAEHKSEVKQRVAKYRAKNKEARAAYDSARYRSDVEGYRKKGRDAWERKRQTIAAMELSLLQIALANAQQDSSETPSQPPAPKT